MNNGPVSFGCCIMGNPYAFTLFVMRAMAKSLSGASIILLLATASVAQPAGVLPEFPFELQGKWCSVALKDNNTVRVYRQQEDCLPEDELELEPLRMVTSRAHCDLSKINRVVSGWMYSVTGSCRDDGDNVWLQGMSLFINRFFTATVLDVRSNWMQYAGDAKGRSLIHWE